MSDQLGHSPVHIAGGRALQDLAVHLAGDAQSRPVGNLVSGDHPWTDWCERVEGLGSRSLFVGALDVAGRDIVDAGVTEDL